MEMWEECAGRQCLRLAFGFRSIPGAGGSERATQTAPRAPPFRRSCSAILISAAFGIMGVVWAEDFLRLMGADANVVAIGTPYTRVMLGGNVVIVLLFLQNTAFRGTGDATTAMHVL